jgi:hypothetical protein
VMPPHLHKLPRQWTDVITTSSPDICIMHAALTLWYSASSYDHELGQLVQYRQYPTYATFMIWKVGHKSELSIPTEVTVHQHDKWQNHFILSINVTKQWNDTAWEREVSSLHMPWY